MGCGRRPLCHFSGFSTWSGRGQEGPRLCSRKRAAMVVATAGRRPGVGAELLAGPGRSCCCSWSEGWKGGLAVPELWVGCRGSGGGEAVVLSSMRTQRSLNCRGRWCVLCLLCHFLCRPNSSSWLRLSGSRRCGDRAGSSSSGGAVGVTEGASGTAAAGVTGAGLVEVPSGEGAGLWGAGLERGNSTWGTCIGECHPYVAGSTIQFSGSLSWQEKVPGCPCWAR